jgi:hypothetical protein
MDKILRIFPRKTKATPEDEDIRFNIPGLFDEADKILISVTFIEDIEKAEKLYDSWKYVSSNITIGGPAYNDPGDEFTPGLFLKHGYLFTSRGCPNHCWYCKVHPREGNIRELKIHEGNNILDSNILACSEKHIKAVFEMLKKQKERPKFTGGLDTNFIKPWVVEALKELNPKEIFFAYDKKIDYDPLVETCKLLKQYEELPNPSNKYRCYVLCGYEGDTKEAAEVRLNQVLELGLLPMAMLFDKEKHRQKNDGWIKFQWNWCRMHIVGTKLREKIINREIII